MDSNRPDRFHRDENNETPPPPIAIVGMGMRLPGGIKTAESFWDLLMSGKDAHGRVPDSRYNSSGHHDPSMLHSVRSEHGYFLQEDPAYFDAKFFSIPGYIAEGLDPQQRLLLEVVWECMENAGLVDYQGENIGCFAGVWGNDWSELFMQDKQDYDNSRMSACQSFSGGSRISYVFDLMGPSITYSTACSSSMTALHDACRALYSGDCTAAIVAGVSLIFTPTTATVLSDHRGVSVDGTCKTFDADADGYGRGEAVNAIVIKRLDDALRDGDPIRAVIRGTSANHDGRAEGEGVPRRERKEQLIRKAYEDAQINDINQTAYIECHGSGTQKGDIAEVTAIGNVFERGIIVGSSRANVGHSEAASGLTSIIKAVLMLEHKKIPPNIHIRKLNPKIPFQARGIDVPLEAVPWPADRLERISVNSFGVGGSNAHVILDSANSFPAKANGSLYTDSVQLSYTLLPISAASEESLRNQSGIIEAYVDRNPQALNDLAYTLSARRQHLAQRGFVCVADEKPTTPHSTELSSCGQFSAVSFVFTGQGARCTRAGKLLFSQCESFREDIRCMDGILEQLEDKPRWTIEAELLKDCDIELESPDTICTAFHIALSNLFSKWGVIADSVVGDPIGEIGAAYSAGAIPLTTAIILSYYRSMAAAKQESSYQRRRWYERVTNPYLLKNKPRVPLYSTTTKGILSAAIELDTSHWARGLDCPDSSLSALKTLAGNTDRNRIFLEIGLETATAELLGEICCSTSPGSPRFHYLPAILDETNPVASLVEAVGKLYMRHIPINLQAINQKGRVLTDLDPYPWTHDKRYWHESRLAKEWRTCKFKRHPLLGSPCFEATSPEPSWRNRLKPVEIPWILENKVFEQSHFPLGAYISMVGEAVRQISGCKDYTIRALTLKLPLVLARTSMVEIVTNLRGTGLYSHVSSDWYDFSISSYGGEQWNVHCVGQVKPGQDTSIATEIEDIQDYPRQVPSEKWYGIMKERGLSLGLTFCGLESISVDPQYHKASASLRRKENCHQNDFSIIEQGIHLLSVASCHGLARHLTLGLPVKIGKAYIGQTIGEAAILRASPRLTATDHPSIYSGNVVAINDEKLALFLGDVHFKGLVPQGPSDLGCPLASRIEWQPDIDLICAHDYLYKSFPNTKSMAIVGKIIMATAFEAAELFGKLPSTPEASASYGRCVENNFSRFIDLFKWGLPEAVAWPADPVMAQAQILQELNLAATSMDATLRPARGFLLTALDTLGGGRSLVEYFMGGDGLKTIYEFTATCIDIGYAFSLLGHSNPSLRVLEIDPTTTGTTAAALCSLQTSAGLRLFSKYTVSTNLPERIKEIRESFGDIDRLEVRYFNPLVDVQDQEFEPASYDLIIIPNVLPSRGKIEDALHNLRSLLDKGGRLMVREVTPAVLFTDYLTSFMPGGGILSHGLQSPNPYPPEYWKEKLHATGFEEPQVATCSTNVYPWNLKQTILAKLPCRTNPTEPIYVVSESPTHQFVQSVVRRLRKEGYSVNTSSLEDLPPTQHDTIFLLDLEEPFFKDIPPSRYQAFQRYLSQHRRTLWVTHALQMQNDDPSFGLVLGLARTARFEEGVEFVTVEAEKLNLAAVGAVIGIYEKLCHQSLEKVSHPDCEFVIHNDKVHVGRFHWTHTDELRTVPPTGGLKVLQIADLGHPNSPVWKERPSQPLNEGEVEIEVYFAELDSRILEDSLGGTKSDDERVLPAAGIVRQVGKGVTHLHPGDKVYSLGSGPLATRATFPHWCCFNLSEDISLSEAATIPFAYATAIYSLLWIGQLEKGQSVFIQSACSPIGQAALQICQLMNAQVYATVDNELDMEYLVDTLEIPRRSIFLSGDGSSVRSLMRETGGNGVDIVLNSLTGDMMYESWACVAPFGKMIHLGNSDLTGPGSLPMESLASNRSFFSVDVLQLAQRRPDHFYRLMRMMHKLNQTRKLQPLRPMKVFDAGDIQKGFDYLRQNVDVGNMLIRLAGSSGSIPVCNSRPEIRLNPDGAYLLVGGLGGIGRAVSTWMVERGARHLVMLSRSATAREDHESFLEELRYQGCNVTLVGGDVAILGDVERAIHKSPKPILGVIHMGMVLKAAPLLEASHEDWVSVQRSKVDGAWNLHHALESTKLDFFVVLSSTASLCGHIGQANYASANSFLDAFVKFRRSRGLTAAGINLGAVRDIGCWTQAPDTLLSAQSSGVRFLNEVEVMGALETAIDGCRRDGGESQVIVGMSSTRSSADPLARRPWSQDGRYRLYQNLEYEGHDEETNPFDEAMQFLEEAKRCPKRLKDPRANEIVLKLMGAQFTGKIPKLADVPRIAEMNLDSLMLIEAIGGVRRMLGMKFIVPNVLTVGTLGELTQAILDSLEVKLASDM